MPLAPRRLLTAPAARFPAELQDRVLKFALDQLSDERADIWEILSTACAFVEGCGGSTRNLVIKEELLRRCTQATQFFAEARLLDNYRDRAAACNLLPWLSVSDRMELVDCMFKSGHTPLVEIFRNRCVLPKETLQWAMNKVADAHCQPDFNEVQDVLLAGMLADTDTPLDPQWLRTQVDRFAQFPCRKIVRDDDDDDVAYELRDWFIPWLGHGSPKFREGMIRDIVNLGAGDQHEKLIDSLQYYDGDLRQCVIANLFALRDADGPRSAYALGYLAAAPGLTSDNRREIGKWLDNVGAGNVDFEGYALGRQHLSSVVYPELEGKLIDMALSKDASDTNRLTAINYVGNHDDLYEERIGRLLEAYSPTNINPVEFSWTPLWAGATSSLWSLLSPSQQQNAKDIVLSVPHATARAACLRCMAEHLDRLDPDGRTWVVQTALDNLMTSGSDASPAFWFFEAVLPHIDRLSPADQKRVVQQIEAYETGEWARCEKLSLLGSIVGSWDKLSRLK